MSEIFAKAAQPGVVREFSIHGLYGYRSLHLRAHHSASILIARNGMGKTTLLAALNVFLKRQFHRLAEIDFEHIECNLQGSVIQLWKFEVEPLRVFMAGPSFAQLVESTKVPGPELLDFLLGDYDPSEATISIHESEIGEQILQA